MDRKIFSTTPLCFFFRDCDSHKAFVVLVCFVTTMCSSSVVVLPCSSWIEESFVFVVEDADLEGGKYHKVRRILAKEKREHQTDSPIVLTADLLREGIPLCVDPDRMIRLNIRPLDPSELDTLSTGRSPLCSSSEFQMCGRLWKFLTHPEEGTCQVFFSCWGPKICLQGPLRRLSQWRFDTLGGEIPSQYFLFTFSNGTSI